jgi:hypothetical protein
MPIPDNPLVARADHQHAVVEFLAAARAVSADAWERTPDATHWSPAQIAQHVRMTYEVVSAQFAGGPGLRVRTPWWLRVVLRWKFLKGLLESGIFPRGARAPREISPGDGPFDREAVLNALQHAATDVEHKFVHGWRHARSPMTHHVFGVMRPPEAARLITVHTAHHAKQLREIVRRGGSQCVSVSDV